MKSTRKYILAVCALAIGFAVPAIRAEDAPAPKPEKKESGPKGGGTERLAKMKEALGLTDAQVEQIKKILDDERAQMKALREKEGEPKEKRAEMMKIREATKAKVDAVLTAEQKAKLEEMRKEREAKGPKGPKPGKDAPADK
ncbi:MAG: Spy/CpxP family protein refolding chaperone [Opitutaceae bacterium]|jgi:Spy/CpxP family protein refolding chaperone